jgi:tRNA G18 (ribose-2'-O)-methylase SpoU
LQAATPTDLRKEDLSTMALDIIRIDSVELPEMEPYRTLKRPLEHHRAGFFVAEGEKVVHRLLQSSLRIRSLLLTEEWLAAFEVLIQQRREDPKIYLAEKSLMEGIVGIQLHKGIMAIADIPKEITIQEAATNAVRPYLFVAVDGIMNSENLGVIVRNCASFGVDALLVGETSCDPYLRRSVRNSMGNIFTLPIVRTSRIADELANVRSSFGVKIIGAHPRDSSTRIESVDFTADCCLVFGGEGHGISDRVLEVCDIAAAIPMLKDVDSINVASASAVLLYEVRRQRSVT